MSTLRQRRNRMRRKLTQNTNGDNAPSTQNISKAAKELAVKSQVDLNSVVGTGKNGQITITDVQKAIDLQIKGNIHQNNVPTGVERPDELIKNIEE